MNRTIDSGLRAVIKLIDSGKYAPAFSNKSHPCDVSLNHHWNDEGVSTSLLSSSIPAQAITGMTTIISSSSKSLLEDPALSSMDSSLNHYWNDEGVSTSLLSPSKNRPSSSSIPAQAITGMTTIISSSSSSLVEDPALSSMDSSLSHYWNDEGESTSLLSPSKNRPSSSSKSLIEDPELSIFDLWSQAA